MLKVCSNDHIDHTPSRINVSWFKPLSTTSLVVVVVGGGGLSRALCLGPPSQKVQESHLAGDLFTQQEILCDEGMDPHTRACWLVYRIFKGWVAPFNTRVNSSHDCFLPHLSAWSSSLHCAQLTGPRPTARPRSAVLWHSHKNNVWMLTSTSIT